MIKKIDNLGRVVVPKSFRHALGIEAGDPLNVEVEGNRITITREKKRCVFCGNPEVTATHLGKHVCRGCLDSLVNRGA